MAGKVVPGVFWANVDRFLEIGTGFAAIADDRPVALAFSSFVTTQQLELGIETLREYRGKAFATSACAALINYCFEKHLEPVWACRLENTASHRLAKRLGFVPIRHLPYFRLAANA